MHKTELVRLVNTYYNTRYSTKAINSAVQEFVTNNPQDKIDYFHLRCGDENSEWDFDTYEQFLVEYPSATTYELGIYGENKNQLMLGGRRFGLYNHCTVTVSAPEKKQIEKLIHIFEEDKSKVVNSSLRRKDKGHSKKKNYHNIKFSSNIIRTAYEKFIDIISKEEPDDDHFSLTINGEEWELPNIEEFLAEYENAEDYYLRLSHYSSELSIDDVGFGPTIRVSHVLKDKIALLFNIFEDNKHNSILKKTPERFTVFIGHGGSNQWK